MTNSINEIITYIINLIINMYEFQIYVMLGFTFIALLIWLIFGRNKKIIPQVNPYPPKNKNSAEVGVEYSGFGTKEEIVSLILYLANKGYMTIEEKNDGIILNKIKEYDGKNSIEKKLFNAIFAKKNTISDDELRNSDNFTNSCSDLVLSLNSIRKHIFKKNNFSIFILAICILMTFILILTNINIISFFLLTLCIFFMFLLYFVFKTKNVRTILMVSWPFLLFIGIFIFIIFNTTPNIINKLPKIITGIICLTISIKCLWNNIHKRSKYGIKVLNEVLGLKQFIETAEEKQIEMLIFENSHYYSDVLPYAYSLKALNIWIDKAKNLSIYPPEWYIGTLNSDSFLIIIGYLLQATNYTELNTRCKVIHNNYRGHSIH